MFQTKVVEKIKTHILCSVTFFTKSCPLWDNVEKYGRVEQSADNNIIRRMRFACRITKARIQTHTQNMQYLLIFDCNIGYAKGPEIEWQCVLSVVRTECTLVPECIVVATIRQVPVMMHKFVRLSRCYCLRQLGPRRVTCGDSWSRIVQIRAGVLNLRTDGHSLLPSYLF